jgi:hypothetical protein
MAVGRLRDEIRGVTSHLPAFLSLLFRNALFSLIGFYDGAFSR